MKRHTTDLVSLVFGLAFVGIAAWWLVSLYFDIRVPHLGWFAAAGLIVFGLLGVFVSLRGGDRTPPPLDEPAPSEEDSEPAHSPPPTA